MKPNVNQLKGPIKVTINEDLDKLDTTGMFQDKLDKVNEILKKSPPPTSPRQKKAGSS